MSTQTRYLCETPGSFLHSNGQPLVVNREADANNSGPASWHWNALKQVETRVEKETEKSGKPKFGIPQILAYF